MEIALPWIVGDNKTSLILSVPPGGGGSYFHIMRNNYFLGQAVNSPEGWRVHIQGKSSLSTDEITFLEDLLNTSYMNEFKLDYQGEEITIVPVKAGEFKNYIVRSTKGERLLVPFEVNGKQEWGFQNDGPNDESISLGKFIEENDYEIDVSIPILTWEEYAEETGEKSISSTEIKAAL